MNELLSYESELKRLMDMQQKLVPIATELVRPKPAKIGLLEFSPTTSSISEQICNWPNFIPIGTWIEPPLGNIELSGDTWEFNFQTQQVVFMNLRDRTCVRAEYSVMGDVGITSWAMYLFLKSRLMNGQIEESSLVEHNKEFFSYLINCGKIKMIGDGPLGGAVSLYVP
jgi:hypothetical protein